VDLSPEVLEQSRARIQQSITRVAKKMFKEDSQVRILLKNINLNFDSLMAQTTVYYCI
jgi:hypothetical protein